MSFEEFHVSEPWRAGLAQAGLDSFDALMAVQPADCLSWHLRGQTYRLALPDGRTVFLKRDALTLTKQLLGDLLRLRRTQPMTYKERLAMERASAAGIRTAETIAWGQRRRLGLAFQGVLVTGVLAGEGLDDFLRSQPPGEPRRQTMRAVGEAIGRLYSAGLNWPDLVARHVYAAPGLTVGMLDLERLHPARRGLRQAMRRQVDRFIRDCLRAGAGPDETAALLEALGRHGPAWAQKTTTQIADDRLG